MQLQGLGAHVFEILGFASQAVDFLFAFLQLHFLHLFQYFGLDESLDEILVLFAVKELADRALGDF